MNRKIFRSTFSVAILVFLASVVLIMGILYGYLESYISMELKREAEYLAHAVENEGVAFFDNFESSENRITLIAPDGRVMADTSADEDKMDNHKDRDEVRQAMETGTGTSTRYSGTLMERTVYYAVKLSDGSILRVSVTHYTIAMFIMGLLQPMIIVLVIALILSLVLSSRVSRSIIKPINNIDPDNPEESDVYEELHPLLRKISIQKKTITNQLKDARQKQEEFRLITENMSEGLLVIDNRYNILTYNSSALHLLDIDRIHSGSVLVLNRSHTFRDTVNSALEGNRTECVMTHGEREYSLIANPVFEEGEIIGAVIVILDVTEKAKREALRREFTANVSHELKTPLTSISGFAELIKDGIARESDIPDFSKSIYDEAQRLISLVGDIIKISELDERSDAFEYEEVDMLELAESVAIRLKSAGDRNGVSISVTGENATVFGVSKILDEMVYNLVDNGIKYNTEKGSVNINIGSNDNSVTVAVKDTGIGIPSAYQSRVFERFFRVDKSHSKEIGGTGLGLSIVKHGASYHNADISLESTEGKGTTITLSFPKNNTK